MKRRMNLISINFSMEYQLLQSLSVEIFDKPKEKYNNKKKRIKNYEFKIDRKQNKMVEQNVQRIDSV